MDGSKSREVNGRKNMYNQEILESKQRHIEERLSKYLEQLAEEDAKEEIAEIETKIEELLARKERYERYQEELETSGESQLLTTDPATEFSICTAARLSPVLDAIIAVSYTHLDVYKRQAKP